MFKAEMILNDAYKLLTHQKTIVNEFQGVYATDLLSSAIKHVKHQEALITLIASQTTISLAVMLDIHVIVIVDDQEVEQKLIDRANKEDIAIIKTNLLTHEVIIDFYQRGII
jgi:serine kinase of HPr protein (carbohydrate metabolism regulator)